MLLYRIKVIKEAIYNLAMSFDMHFNKNVNNGHYKTIPVL
jgi:hypothetical protein